MVAGRAEREIKRREVPPDIHCIAILVYSLKPKLQLRNAVRPSCPTAIFGVVERYGYGSKYRIEFK
jgi:hypothetical protein